MTRLWKLTRAAAAFAARQFFRPLANPRLFVAALLLAIVAGLGALIYRAAVAHVREPVPLEGRP